MPNPIKGCNVKLHTSLIGPKVDSILLSILYLLKPIALKKTIKIQEKKQYSEVNYNIS